MRLENFCYVIVLVLIPYFLFRLYRYDLMQNGKFRLCSKIIMLTYASFAFGFMIWPAVVPTYYHTLSEAVQDLHTSSNIEVYTNAEGNMAYASGTAFHHYFEKNQRGWTKIPDDRIDMSHAGDYLASVTIDYLNTNWMMVLVEPMSIVEETSAGKVYKKVPPIISDSLGTKFVTTQTNSAIAFIKDMPDDYTIIYSDKRVRVAELEVFSTPILAVIITHGMVYGVVGLLYIAATWFPIGFAVNSAKKTREKLQSNISQKDTPRSDQE